jgi:hypothetical protein
MAIMAIKLGLELILEGMKQQKRVQELSALYDKAVADEKKAAVEMAMYNFHGQAQQAHGKGK